MNTPITEKVSFDRRFMSNEDNLHTIQLQILAVLEAVKINSILPRTQREISVMLGTTQPTVSKHLQTLEVLRYVIRLPLEQRQFRLAETAPATCDSRAAKHWFTESGPST